MPPASSAGLTIRFPDERRAKLLRNASLACDKLNDAVVAVELLFTTMDILLRFNYRFVISSETGVAERGSGRVVFILSFTCKNKF
jgi:hypothetical protein